MKSGIIENDYDLISNNKKTLFQDLINQFVKEISLKKIEIYNEASIQHELVIFLRSHLSNYKIQFERNISVFGLDKKRFMKKEIDLVIFNTDNHDIYAIEIKFPNNGAYPNQMLIICEDLKFLEELKQSNFTKCFCLVFANDDNFWNSKGSRHIYQKFRKEKVFEGRFEGKINQKKLRINLNGSYKINWKSIDGFGKHFLISV